MGNFGLEELQKNSAGETILGVEIPDYQVTGNPKSMSKYILPNFRLKQTPEELLEYESSPAVLYIVDKYLRVQYMSNRFYLVGAEEVRQEKSQVIETFGSPSYFFFGERSKIYNFSGHLLETNSTNNVYRYKYLWASTLTDMYEKYLRGTKLAENGQEAILTFKSTRLYGYILNLNVVHNAKSPNSSAFSFSMLVRKQDFILPPNADNNVLENLYDVTHLQIGLEAASELRHWADQIKNLAEKLEENGFVQLKERAVQYLRDAYSGASNSLYLFAKDLIQKNASAHEAYLIKNNKIEGIGRIKNSSPTIEEFIETAYHAANSEVGYVETLTDYFAAVSQYNQIFDQFQSQHSGWAENLIA
jgi:hypothetical protein